MPGIDSGTFSSQVFNQPVMVEISGPCAFSTRAARSLTWGEAARPSASSAISTACWWCGIMPWAKETSWALWAPAEASADTEGDEAADPLSSPPPPQAARANTAVTVSAAKRVVRMLELLLCERDLDVTEHAVSRSAGAGGPRGRAARGRRPEM